MTLYTVKKGDSLWKIAVKFLGDGSRYVEIKELNGLSSDVIHVGQVLKIPAGTAATPEYEAVVKQLKTALADVEKLPSVRLLNELLKG